MKLNLRDPLFWVMHGIAAVALSVALYVSPVNAQMASGFGGGWVPASGGTFTGPVTWSLGTSNPVVLSPAGPGLTTYNYFSLNGVVTSSGGVGIFGGDSGDSALYLNSPTSIASRIGTAVTFSVTAVGVLMNGSTAIPAGGTAGLGYRFSSTSNFGVFFGSGAPTLSAAKGSIYLRSDGTTTNDRMYVNTNGSTAWTAVTTAS